ncbi:hypothetical protein EDC04DRAFT_2580982, partial [Pisolithus marmoratus]
TAGSITGIVGNPGEVIMVHLQCDFAKPPKKHFNYKHCFDALFRVTYVDLISHFLLQLTSLRPLGLQYSLPMLFAWHHSLRMGTHDMSNMAR